MAYGRWPRYVSVAERRAKAARQVQKLRRQGAKLEPIEIQGRKIARTFWGQAWCEHLEQFSDYANRLPRGRTYLCNGLVCHLLIKKGRIEAIVTGSHPYRVTIKIRSLSALRWKKIRSRCAGQIGSMLELLQGRLSSQVMGMVTDPQNGLFPHPKEIDLDCDCPDWAVMCKHVAAVLYGVGARLDREPEQLFLLRNVDHQQLISTDLDVQAATAGRGQRRRLANPDLAGLFGIEIEPEKPRPKKASKPKAVPKRTSPGPTGAAIRRMRERSGMSRSQFARLIDVSPQTIANWENQPGKLKLRRHHLEALIGALQTE
jgi:uncharacterized Zn finger protein